MTGKVGRYLLIIVALAIPCAQAFAGPFDESSIVTPEAPAEISAPPFADDPVVVTAPGSPDPMPKIIDAVIREAAAMPTAQRGSFLLEKAWEIARTPDEFLALANASVSAEVRNAILEIGCSKVADYAGYLKIVKGLSQRLPEGSASKGAALGQGNQTPELVLSDDQAVLKRFFSGDVRERARRTINRGIALAEEATSPSGRLASLKELYSAVANGKWAHPGIVDEILKRAGNYCSTMDQFKGLIALEPGDHVLSVIYDQWSGFGRPTTDAQAPSQGKDDPQTLTLYSPELEAQFDQERPTTSVTRSIGLVTGMGFAALAATYGQ